MCKKATMVGMRMRRKEMVRKPSYFFSFRAGGRRSRGRQYIIKGWCKWKKGSCSGAKGFSQESHLCHPPVFSSKKTNFSNEKGKKQERVQEDR